MRPIQKKTVFVGMSGGVDSSVSAALLRDRGYRVVGVHLKCWNVDGCAQQDAEDARRAAETLNIPFYVFDFEKEYKERVVAYMVAGYKKGITPNPDVACNQEIKFGLFYKRAMEMGADYVATGHYVRLRNTKKYESTKKKGSYIRKKFVIRSLYIAKDKTKDQSYFLWTLTQKQLAHCLFPLGDLIKRTQVRALAKKYKLPNAEKKDSQGICFIGQVSLPEFLSTFIPQRKGAVVNTAGEQIGEHQGAQYYTIGQRKGLGIGGSPVPLYVSEKDMKKNTITIAPEGDESLYQSKVVLSDVNFISPLPLMKHTNKLEFVSMSVWCRVRYRQPLFRAKLIFPRPSPPKAGRRALSAPIRVLFERPQKAVAPGQSAVFYSPFRKGRGPLAVRDFSGKGSIAIRRGGIYSGGEMLGGGIITSAH